MLLGGAKDEYFSCFLSSCQLGLKIKGICHDSEELARVQVEIGKRNWPLQNCHFQPFKPYITACPTPPYFLTFLRTCTGNTARHLKMADCKVLTCMFAAMWVLTLFFSTAHNCVVILVTFEFCMRPVYRTYNFYIP